MRNILFLTILFMLLSASACNKLPLQPSPTGSHNAVDSLPPTLSNPTKLMQTTLPTNTTQPVSTTISPTNTEIEQSVPIETISIESEPSPPILNDQISGYDIISEPNLKNCNVCSFYSYFAIQGSSAYYSVGNTIYKYNNEEKIDSVYLETTHDTVYDLFIDGQGYLDYVGATEDSENTCLYRVIDNKETLLIKDILRVNYATKSSIIYVNEEDEFCKYDLNNKNITYRYKYITPLCENSSDPQKYLFQYEYFFHDGKYGIYELNLGSGVIKPYFTGDSHYSLSTDMTTIAYWTEHQDVVQYNILNMETSDAWTMNISKNFYDDNQLCNGNVVTIYKNWILIHTDTRNNETSHLFFFDLNDSRIDDDLILVQNREYWMFCDTQVNGKLLFYGEEYTDTNDTGINPALFSVDLKTRKVTMTFLDTDNDGARFDIRYAYGNTWIIFSWDQFSKYPFCSGVFKQQSPAE